MRQVDIFLAVAATLNFSQAAVQCHLSQPALSANVKRLEDAVGAKLFDRHTRKVALTPAGREFFLLAMGLADNMQIALTRMGDFVAGKRGRLVLAAAPSVAASFVPGVLAVYKREHPDIEVEIHDELSDLCLEMLRQGSADIAITAFEAKAKDLVQRELFRDPLVVICPANHSLAGKSTVRWRDVQTYPQIVMNRTSNLRQLVDAEYVRSGMTLQPAYEVSQVATMLGLIAADLGIGELPQSLVRDLAMKGLIYRRISNVAASRSICAVTLKHREANPVLKSFIEVCRIRAGDWSGVRAAR